MVFNFLLQINFQILAGIGKIRERLRILLIGLAVNVPLNLLFIPVFGAAGSALAVGMSWIPLWHLSHKECGAAYSLDFEWKYFMRNVFFLAAVSFGLFLARHSWSPE